MYYNPYLQHQYQQEYRQQQAPQQQMYQQQPQTSSNQDDRIWVQGEGAAQAYLVAPNSFVRLWDSTGNVFYEKQADASGRPIMKIYEYSQKPVNSPDNGFCDNDCINLYKDQLKALSLKIDALERKIKMFEGRGMNYAADESNADDQ